MTIMCTNEDGKIVRMDSSKQNQVLVSG